MAKKKVHFYLSKVKRIFTSAYRKSWNEYTDLQEKHNCNLNGTLTRNYNCKSKHMGMLKGMTVAERIVYRPRQGFVSTSVDMAMPTRDPGDEEADDGRVAEMTVEEAIQRDLEIYTCYEDDSDSVGDEEV